MPASTEVHVSEIPLKDIAESPYQPRSRKLAKKDVAELIGSIEAIGQTTPVILAPIPDSDDGKFYVHAGHRRCAALRFLGEETVKAVVRRDLDEKEARKLAIGDNLGREDLTAYEQAVAIKGYADVFRLPFEAAAVELGIKRSTAYRLQAMLGASESLRDVIRDECISARVAELLTKIETRAPKKALRLADKFAAGHLSIKKLEAELKTSSSKGGRATATQPDVEFRRSGNTVRLSVLVRLDELTQAKRERIVRGVNTLLSSLHLGEVTQVAPDSTNGQGA